MAKNINLLSYDDLAALGYGSRTTIWRRVNNGKFPPPIDTGSGGKRWRETKVIDWLERKEDQSAQVAK